MAILKVARMGHPVLAAVAEPVAPDRLGDPGIQAFIDDMLETMVDERGVGLAAPQVHRSIRLFVMDPPSDRAPDRDADSDAEPSEPFVVVNPVLTFPGETRIGLWEGCLSMPGIRGLTERWKHVHLECLDREGRPQSLDFSGYASAVVQHETDHLDGVLFLERMPQLATLSFEDELSRYGGPLEDDNDEADGAEVGGDAGADGVDADGETVGE